MWSEEFKESALAIEKEITKWNEDKGTNFGFITDNKGNYRIFCGGDTDRLIDGISVALLNIMQQIDDKNGKLVDEISRVVHAMLEERKGEVVQ
jgi:hypothetical protein